MNTLHEKFHSHPLPVMLLIALVALLAGCEQAAQPAQGDQSGGDHMPLGQVAEFDGFTLRANVSPTATLPDAMASRYGIEAGPDVFLLNLVILQKRPDQQPVPVAAEVSAKYENLVGHSQTIDMRMIEADGNVTYLGTLDTSGQRIFRFIIEAQPEAAAQPLSINFEVQLPALDADQG